MNDETIEKLLRQARPQSLPPALKARVIHAAYPPTEKSSTWIPRAAWSVLAACWITILALYAHTPSFPQGPWTISAQEYLASLEYLRNFNDTDGPPDSEEPIPLREPLKMETIFRRPPA
jgi:hypothetical protein